MNQATTILTRAECLPIMIRDEKQAANLIVLTCVKAIAPFPVIRYVGALNGPSKGMKSIF